MNNGKEKEALLSEEDSEDTLVASENGTPASKYNYEGTTKKKGWNIIRRFNFPFSVLFIVGNEFCERFSYYGMRAVLVLFLHNQLFFSEDSSTAIYHAFIMLCYILPLLGAVISDSCLGKYGTILSLSLVYAVGNVLVSVSAIPFQLQAEIALAAIGLIVIALGTGGIKPCVSAFGGDQFKEGQTDNLRRFFSLFYFSINAGSVISTLLTPVLRNYVNCFETCQCYALAFGVPAVLMVISLIIFVLGTKFYVIKKPKKEDASLYLRVPASIVTAIVRRIKHGKSPDKKHFLQYACPVYTTQFMEDVRMLLRVLVMLLPLPIFWALFDQQGSRWTLQATRMNGQLGSFAIQPDQMQALNPILILVFIPIFEIVVYPLFSKCHIFRRPLQRMVVGMFIGGLAFVAAGFVQLAVQNAAVNLKPDESKAVFVNTLPNDIQFDVTGVTNTTYNLTQGEHIVTTSFPPGSYSLAMTYDGQNEEVFFDLNGRNITQIVFALSNTGSLVFISNEFVDEPVDGGKSSLQVINAMNESSREFSIVLTINGEAPGECSEASFEALHIEPLTISNRSEVDVGSYEYAITEEANSTVGRSSYTYDTDFNILLFGNGSVVPETGDVSDMFQGGATYTLIVTSSNFQGLDVDANGLYNVTVIQVDPPNSVSMFLQVPMYFLITAGEVMFSVTGLEFAYSQAPVSMKAMCQAAWLMTVAFGNLVVIIVAESSIFEDQAIEFFFFALLIGVVSIIFAIMSFFYKYVDLSDPAEKDDTGESSEPHSTDHIDESSALIMDKSGVEEADRTEGGYISESDMEFGDRSSKSILTSESEF